LRRLVIASVLLVYVSYWFVMEPAQAHAFYVLAPIAVLFSAYCWSIVDSPSARRAAAFVVVINIAFHGGLAFVRLREDSLYTRRDVVAAAIESKDPGMLGHRRAFARDAGPYELDTAIPRDPRRDLMVMQPQYTTRFDGSVHWSFVLENANPRVAYRDVLYFATYKQADGTEVQRHEYIKEIFEPCDVRAIDLNDGYIDRPFVSASIRVAAAEALVPASAAACRPR
jgi:hypothetical protein